MDRHFIWSRKTIEDVIYTEGIGIHSGKSIRMKLLPAEVDTGIIFINKKYGIKYPIKAIAESVIDTNFAVTLCNGKWQVRTVEHLLSVFYTFGITDIIVEIDGDEIPIFDGSATPIINLFNEKRFYIFEKGIEPIEIINPIWIMDGDRFIIALPSDVPKISYTIRYDHPIVKTQYAQFTLTKDTFKEEIAPARTYGFEKDVESLQKSSFAMGGSLNNALVISDDSYINEPRFSDECVRHKILDFIGDIALIGKPVLGYFIVCRSGHTFDIRFVKKIIEIYSNIDIGKNIDSPIFARRKV
ncbi:MAG: UDP-3-O-acyl-N-acetylglucosamine deacetylase [Spirochaetota bacterium]|nr:UDP-3-O-acyl-N-acetylglucosamine deacetylase [Spirochaetota bacterium]